MDRNTATRREQIREEAAVWVVRLVDSDDAAQRAAFERWRSQGVEHEIAFEREMAAWERLDRLKALRFPDGVDDPDLIEPAAIAVPIRRHSLHPRAWRAIAASAVIAIAGGATALWSLAGSPAYATSIGEQKRVQLTDGSVIELNTDTRVVVRYGGSRRLIELERGEALFHVARDVRPFMIHAQAARLDSGGADLSVRVGDTAARVTVRSGVVLASAWHNAEDPAPVTSLGPHSEAQVTPTRTTVRIVSPDEIERSLAWRRGAIALAGETLSEAAREFNRYNLRQISVGDAAAGKVHVGGYFQASDVDGFVGALTKAFAMRAATRPNGDIVVSST